jgi:hypothetical protein
VNLLLDVTDERQVADLMAQATRCRRLADGASDRRTVETLRLMASEYETKAGALAKAFTAPD